MGIKITRTNDTSDYKKIEPDFIFNRYDLYCKKNEFETIKIESGSKTKYIQIKFSKNTAELGIWLTPLYRSEMEHILYYIYKHHKNIKTVSYKNGSIPYGRIKSHNHFRIVFPETKEEMMQRVSGPSKKKLRKKIRLCEKAHGNLTVHEYDRSNLPDEVVEAFFKFKYATRGRKYNMTPKEYLDKYMVSHCYVFKFGGEIAAVRFSCEQCPVVYGENFTYHPDYADYSLGTCIFFYHLIRMTEKKHTQLFFAGGNYEYKTHYESIEEKVFDCSIDLETLDFSRFTNTNSLLYKLKKPLLKHFPNLCRKLNIQKY